MSSSSIKTLTFWTPNQALNNLSSSRKYQLNVKFFCETVKMDYIYQ